VLGRDRFADGLESRMSRMRDARLDAAAERARTGTLELPPTRTLRESWPRLDGCERRDAIARVIDCVFVDPGRLNYDQRILICPRGTGPRDLPRAGDKKSTHKAYAVRASWIKPWPGIGVAR